MLRLSIILVILMAAPRAPAPAASLGRLEISVHSLGGKPISNATVYVHHYEGTAGRTPQHIADIHGRLVLTDLQPGTYEVRARKESEGYADTFFSFFGNGNNKAWQVVKVIADQTTYVDLRLGPKYATLKLLVTDESGKRTSGSMTFIRLDDRDHPYKRGGSLSGEVTMLVPTIPFRFSIEKDGYEVWRSKTTTLRPGQMFTVKARLKLLPN